MIKGAYSLPQHLKITLDKNFRMLKRFEDIPKIIIK